MHFKKGIKNEAYLVPSIRYYLIVRNFLWETCSEIVINICENSWNFITCFVINSISEDNLRHNYKNDL